MTRELVHPILRKPIQTLEVSGEFKAMAKANGFRTLEDILEGPLNDLPFRKLSGYRMLKEFLDILEQNGLGGIINEESV